MADKWTIGLNNEGLYNGVRPPEEGEEKEKKQKEPQEIITVASGKIQPKEKHSI